MSILGMLDNIFPSFSHLISISPMKKINEIVLLQLMMYYTVLVYSIINFYFLFSCSRSKR